MNFHFLIGLNCQFYDDSIGDISVVNLSCKEVFQAHTGENIQKWLEDEIESFKIKAAQVFVITVDSAANITKGVKNLVLKLNKDVLNCIEAENLYNDCFTDGDDQLDDEINNLNVDSNEELIDRAKVCLPDSLKENSFLMNCTVHKVQLAVNRFLWQDDEEVTALVKEAAKIVAKLRTPVLHMKLKLENLKQPKLSVETRWSSVNEMLERLLELKTFCLKNQDSKDMKELRASGSKWNKFAKLHSLLKLPAELTVKLQAEKLLVTDFVYHWFCTMLKIENLAKSDTMAAALLTCLQIREKQIFDNTIIITGWFLDKSLYFMPKMDQSEENKESAKKVIRMVMKKRNMLSQDDSDDLEQDENLDELEDQNDIISPEEEEEDSFDKLLRNCAKKGRRSVTSLSKVNASKLSAQLEEEITKYEAMAAPTRYTRGTIWWKQQQPILPLLAPIALDIISSPVTEVSVERLFSHLNIIIGKHRTTTASATLDAIIFLRMNNVFEKQQTNSNNK